MTSILSTLTDEQRAAVEAEDQTVVVSAPPGSGKTRVLAARALWLISQGIRAERILCLTFTRAACEEIRHRIGHAGVDVSTYHGLAARHVVREGERVATEIEADQAIRGIYDGPSRLPARGRPPITVLRRLITAHEAGSGEASRTIHTVIRRLDAAGLVPTWDLLPRLVVLLDRIIGRYDHVLVDEAQDLTRRELEVDLAGEYVFRVGDPRQAIMGWRGALEPTDLSVGLVVPTHRLTQTFRFGGAIAEVANRVAARFGGGAITGAPDVDSSFQVFDTAEDLLHLASSTFPAETAILCRNHVQCAAVERALGGLGVHVRRDPTVVLDEAADHIAAVQRSGRVVISTIHGFKGKEADHVIVLADDPQHGRPWPRDDADEARVAYVACTRARKTLSLDVRFASWIEKGAADA